jgi:hypothetical protein
MLPRSKYDHTFRPAVITTNVLAFVGAVASVFVMLVRVPAMSTTKIEQLFGTLQGTAVTMLFVVTALLINLTYLFYRANCPQIRDGQSSA